MIMKKILFFLVSILLFSCNDEKQSTYSYVIKNNTDTQITVVVVYSYARDVNARCDARDLSVKLIDIDNTTKIIETNYPYITFFYSFNNTEYCYKFPASDNHYKLESNRVNIISIDGHKLGNNFNILPITP